MAEKTFNGRIVQKHDVEANWIKATNFVPKQGEIIVYDIDGNYSYERIKIGDGVTLVSALPFVDDAVKDLIDTLVGDESVATQIENAFTQREVTSDDVMEYMMSEGIVDPVATADNVVFTDSTGALYTL